jgi:hypothetical protein
MLLYFGSVYYLILWFLFVISNNPISKLTKGSDGRNEPDSEMLSFIITFKDSTPDIRGGKRVQDLCKLLG